MKYHDWKKINIEVNKLQYISHCILNSKYKLLIYIAIYILTYILVINNISITECMNQNLSEENMPQIAPRPENLIAHIRQLEAENAYLHERIIAFEREFRYNLERRFSERSYFEFMLRNALEDNLRLREQLQTSDQTIINTTRALNRSIQENTLLQIALDQNMASNTTDLESENDNS